MVRVAGGTHEIGAAAAASPTTTSGPRHEIELDAFRDRPHAGHATRAFAAYVAETGAEPPLYWERDGEAAGSTTRFGRREPLDPALPVIHVDHRQADATSPPGPASGCRPSSSGRRAAEGSDPRPRQPRPPAFGTRRPAPTPTARPTVARVQMLGDVWEWTSAELRGLPGLRGVPVPRVLRGLLRRRLPGPARRLLGDPPRGDPHDVPQLGPPRAPPDLRRLPLRQGR